MTEMRLSWREPTEATDKLWGKTAGAAERRTCKGGVLDMETEVVSGITAYARDISMKA